MVGQRKNYAKMENSAENKELCRMILDLNPKTLSSNINIGRASLFCLLLHKHLLSE